MAESNRHIILRKVLSVESNRDADNFKLQQQLSAICKERLSPCLEKVFDRFADAKELISVEELNIDLGAMAPIELEEQFVSRVLEAVEIELYKLINDGNEKGGVTKVDVAQSHFEAWLQYLSKGYVHWQTGKNSAQDWEASVLKTVAQSKVAAQQLKALMQRDGVALQRLIRQHSERFLLELVEVLGAMKLVFANLFFEELKKMHAEKRYLFSERKSDALPGHDKLYFHFWKVVFQGMSVPPSQQFDEGVLLFQVAKELGLNEQLTAIKQVEQKEQVLYPVFEKALRQVQKRSVQSGGTDTVKKTSSGFSVDDVNTVDSSSQEEWSTKQFEEKGRKRKGSPKAIIQLPFYAAIHEWGQSIEKLKTLFFETALAVPEEIPISEIENSIDQLRLSSEKTSLSLLQYLLTEFSGHYQKGVVEDEQVESEITENVEKKLQQLLEIQGSDTKKAIDEFLNKQEKQWTHFKNKWLETISKTDRTDKEARKELIAETNAHLPLQLRLGVQEWHRLFIAFQNKLNQSAYSIFAQKNVPIAEAKNIESPIPQQIYQSLLKSIETKEASFDESTIASIKADSKSKTSLDEPNVSDTKNTTTSVEESIIEETNSKETRPEYTGPEEKSVAETSLEKAGPEESTIEETNSKETKPESTVPEETSIAETSLEKTDSEETSITKTNLDKTDPEDSSKTETSLEETSIETSSTDPTSQEELTEITETASSKKEQRTKDTIDIVPNEKIKEPVEHEPASATDSEVPLPSQSAKDTEQASPSLPEGTALYINHAGVILLHPFISTLFKTLGLTEDKDFVNEEARIKGIYLIQYLASGHTDFSDYELILPKLLCALPFEIPVPRNFELTEEEKGEADGLLQAAINHWGALGSSSIDGLREGFLQREGKLTQKKNGNWQLIVEHKTIDILLNKLPWGYGMFQLPWMKERVLVEWVT